MLGLPSSESFRVAALESSIKLHEMSRLLIDLFSFRNSASDSQNMCPRELDDKERLSKLELLFKRSMQSFDPALSSNLFSLSERCFKY